MKHTILILFILGFGVLSKAQEIPQERLVNWSKAGLVEEISMQHQQNVLDNGIVADGVTDNSAKINALIQTLDPFTSLYFPAGKYFFSDPINLKSNISLVGDGIKSHLQFENTNNEHLISITGSATNTEILISYTLLKGNNEIQVSDGSKFTAGEMYQISDDDADKITSSWSANRTGQMVRIAAVNGNTIVLESNLRRSYDKKNNIKMVLINPISGVRVENLYIERLDSSYLNRANIEFKYAYNCEVKCVTSINCDFAHVNFNSSLNNVVKGCFFKDGLEYGGNGEAYGVVFMHTTSECLAIDNIFVHLRHSMLIQSGANGNVFAYNLSTQAYWEETSLPAESAGDMVLHGNYPYANLFESNVCENMVIDDSHGINGPYNTFFRNRARLYGFFMNRGMATDSQNIVANEITNMDFLKGLYITAGKGHFESTNYVKGDEKNPSTSEHPASLFLTTPPLHYSTTQTWPAIGAPNLPNTYPTETQLRFERGKPTKCIDALTVGIEDSKEFKLDFYPNPATTWLHTTYSEPCTHIILLNSLGQSNCRKWEAGRINVSNLAPGVYAVQLWNNNTIISTQTVIIRQ